MLKNGLILHEINCQKMTFLDKKAVSIFYNEAMRTTGPRIWTVCKHKLKPAFSLLSSSHAPSAPRTSGGLAEKPLAARPMQLLLPSVLASPPCLLGPDSCPVASC